MTKRQMRGIVSGAVEPGPAGGGDERGAAGERPVYLAGAPRDAGAVGAPARRARGGVAAEPWWLWLSALSRGSAAAEPGRRP